jgi:hypothetical protein
MASVGFMSWCLDTEVHFLLLTFKVLQQQAPRSSHDKSGDSGISGDASPVGIHEDPSEAPVPLCRKPVVQAGPVRPLVMAWTPQQDLEEDDEESSSDGGEEVPPTTIAGGVQPKFSPRSHVFSLSLPRDDRLCLSLYADNVDVIGSKVSCERPIAITISIQPFMQSCDLELMLRYIIFHLPNSSNTYGLTSDLLQVPAVLLGWCITETKPHGLSPRAKYTDRMTAACRRSQFQLLWIEGVTW